MTDGQEPLPTDPRRVRAFANFFKNYMSVSSVLVAALPIPVTALGALPTFADHKTVLSTYTSLFCFLVLGFIFFMRHGLAKWMFPEMRSEGLAIPPDHDEAARLLRQAQLRARARTLKSVVVGSLPLTLIAITAVLMYLYHAYLDRAIFEIAQGLAVPLGPNIACGELDPIRLARACSVPTPAKILAGSYLEIPWGFWLRPLYIGMFVTAEAAFILMATREYIQDLLQLSDVEVIRGERAPASPSMPNQPIQPTAGSGG